MRTILTNIINPISASKAVYLPRQIITINGNKIIGIEPFDAQQHRSFEDYSYCIALPGFIDLHVHLSQYYIRGMYEPSLLPWLNKVVFPEEARSQNHDYSSKLANEFFHGLAKAGTTCSVIYTAPFPSACEEAFIVAEELGIRALIGMTMMDQNSPSELQHSTESSLENSIALFERWHGKTSLLDYIFTPRFAPTCSMELLRGVSCFASSHQAWIQTHLSENKAEIDWVKELFGLPSYTEVYEQAGLLGPQSIFGHAIHLQDNELRLLADSQSKIAHCPDSNFYLKSGAFLLEKIEQAGIEYGLGSDVGAGSTLNLLHHAQMMNYRQSKYCVMPERALYHITLGSAKVLGMDNKIGSLTVGKDADIVILSPPRGYHISDHILSQLCFFGREFSVIETIVSGKTLYKKE